ncbi:MAG TPA: serine/threonine-protein kinase, partial [Holophaga sp.]|nr:serine/threonine-protein kinase [Holophaga sp.]
MARTLAGVPMPLFGDDSPTQFSDPGDAGRITPLPGWVTEAKGKPGKQIGRFLLGPLRGRGGMGLVYQAYDPTLRRIVALKLVAGRDPSHLTRFQQEARAQAKVDHPNICKVFEVGQIEELPYIAMQYIEGDNLSVLGRDLSLAEKVRVITLAAEALDAAHHAGLIHRDIKPSNIMLEQVEGGWRPYLTDFGLAKEQESAALTLDGKVLGTPSYMAPEQAMGVTGRVDARSDVYALGATFYFLLAERPPIQGPTAIQTLAALAEAEIPALRRIKPEIPLDLAIIVHKCLEREPDRRYASARLLAEDLRRFTQGEPITARP